MATREERLAANESFFREVNEEIERLTEGWALESLRDFVCECSDASCTQVVSMTLKEYRGVRAHRHRFAVVPGHELPEIETVVERHQRYLVVEKHAELAE
jgi:hypothetical protein